MNNIKIYYLISIAVIVLILLTIYVLYQNTYPTSSSITVKSKNIPNGFDGYTIVQISDYHNAHLMRGHGRLISLIENAKPDIIVITGDFFDSRRTELSSSISFANELVNIAPCFYIPGNHESRKADKYAELLSVFDELDVTVLNNSFITLQSDDDKVSLVGITDPAFTVNENDREGIENKLKDNLNIAIPDDDSYKILLSHRPEHIEIYAEQNIDLVLSGHAHGGQLRFPFKNGIIAPGQGFFPKYTSGLYTADRTNMIVSRGIGNSKFPLRINNRPEVVVICLESE